MQDGTLHTSEFQPSEKFVPLSCSFVLSLDHHCSSSVPMQQQLHTISEHVDAEQIANAVATKLNDEASRLEQRAQKEFEDAVKYFNTAAKRAPMDPVQCSSERDAVVACLRDSTGGNSLKCSSLASEFVKCSRTLQDVSERLYC